MSLKSFPCCHHTSLLGLCSDNFPNTMNLGSTGIHAGTIAASFLHCILSHSVNFGVPHRPPTTRLNTWHGAETQILTDGTKEVMPLLHQTCPSRYYLISWNPYRSNYTSQKLQVILDPSYFRTMTAGHASH